MDLRGDFLGGDGLGKWWSLRGPGSVRRWVREVMGLEGNGCGRQWGLGGEFLGGDAEAMF